MDADRVLLCAMTGERDAELLPWAVSVVWRQWADCLRARATGSYGHELWILMVGVTSLLTIVETDKSREAGR